MSMSPYGSPPGPPPPQGQPPVYGAPVPYLQPVYMPGPPTNGMAVASLVCSLVGLLTTWFVPILVSALGVIFGHVALNQIKSKGQGGRGMAIAGLVIGYIVVGLAVAAIVVFVVILGAGVGFSSLLGSTST